MTRDEVRAAVSAIAAEALDAGMEPMTLIEVMSDELTEEICRFLEDVEVQWTAQEAVA